MIYLLPAAAGQNMGAWSYVQPRIATALRKLNGAAPHAGGQAAAAAATTTRKKKKKMCTYVHRAILVRDSDIDADTGSDRDADGGSDAGGRRCPARGFPAHGGTRRGQTRAS